MRPIIIAGNWKMNKDSQTGPELVRAIHEHVRSNPMPEGTGVVLCPPFVVLEPAARILAGGGVRLGAQNMHHEPEGAYTGEISGNMLLAAGCRHVILGHSERRQYFGETDAIVNRKLHSALAVGLGPIVCIGETLEQRESGTTLDVIAAQVRGALDGVTEAQMNGLIIAYEPVWAIGTGRTATNEQAQEVHAEIRGLLEKLYSTECAQNTTIQYGGSMKPSNALDLMLQPDVDGGLVGGACLKAEQFIDIIEAARKAAGQKAK
jgi:triosephosphate isomerase